jgi:sugar O-acyltransferase (sialic acid O-acetyltransferase NeuD family)
MDIIDVMKDIIIYGFGGFGREMATILGKINEIAPTWNLLGYIDDGYDPGIKNKYGKILGNIDFLNSYDKPVSVLIAIGTPSTVKKLVDNIHNPNVDYPNIVAPSVYFYDKNTVKLGKGNIITAGARISCDVCLGDFNILNSGVYLGHDVYIGNYNLLEPEVRLSGGVNVGNANFFGTRSTVLQYIKISDNTRIGACSLILRNPKGGCLYMGNPAKKIDGI